MISNTTHTNNYINPTVRQIAAKVELYTGSTLAATYKHTDALVSFEVERVGVGKFFGYGICQKINIKLRDMNRSINITTEHSFKVYFNDLCVFPVFYVSEVHRDENTNELSVTAYDALYKANKHTFSEIDISAPYNLRNVATKVYAFLGLSGLTTSVNNTAFDASYTTGANYEGKESLREVLDDIAEAAVAIYFVDYNNKLKIKRLTLANVSPNLTIGKDKYFTLESKTNRKLTTITHATDLGNNLTVSTGAIGSTQFVRNNPFWDLREDIDTLMQNAINLIGNLTINQFECEWRGNYLLEIGDKIALTTKDNTTVTSFLLDDILTYDGALSQKSRWSYEDNEEETASNPVSLGDALNQTFARVDKVNKQIDLVVSDTEANKESISSLQLNIEGISASVTNVEKNYTESIDGINTDLGTLTQKVEAAMTAEDVTLQIKSELDNGVTKVETNTGFTFNDEGLTVSKTNSEMTTTITEDGMTVYKNDEAVLTANNVGVNAKNLHATTYLIIGNNSRFEDYGDRTGCFWIGGN